MKSFFLSVPAFTVAAAAVLPAQILPRAPSGAPVAKVANGSYYGIHNSNYNQDFFLGVPFAQPPLQNLRLANPQSLNFSWDGALPATDYAFVGVSPAWANSS
jgi:acetylcholinesterase